MREDGRNLEGAHHAHARHFSGFERRDVLTVIENLARAHRQELGEQIEHGGFAGAVRPDQRVNRTTLDLQVHAVHGNEAFELTRELLGF